MQSKQCDLFNLSKARTDHGLKTTCELHMNQLTICGTFTLTSTSLHLYIHIFLNQSKCVEITLKSDKNYVYLGSGWELSCQHNQKLNDNIILV